MFSTGDTIVAIATPQGHGGLGVVRLSGPEALDVGQRLLDRPLAPRHATFARVHQPPLASEDGRATARAALDHVVATFFPGPGSYTGEDVVELSAHGSPVVLRQIVDGAMRAGARLAGPGEFTLRAFLHGRIDLVQAEAVADLVAAVTPAQARTAFDQLDGTLTGRIAALDEALFDVTARLEASLDFPDEGYHFIEPAEIVVQLGHVAAQLEDLLRAAERGRLIREGATVVLTGRPNVGKSSLFNRLVGVERAIVAAGPGTTRDFITETVEIGGIPVTLVDTAGDHGGEPASGGDAASKVRGFPRLEDVERAGVQRARQARRAAALAVVVLDRSAALDARDRAVLADTRGRPRLLVVNKCDLPVCWDPATVAEPDAPAGETWVEVSTLTGAGLPELRERIAGGLAGDRHQDSTLVTNVRHLDLLSRARAGLERARAAAQAGLSEEFVLVDLRDAQQALEEVTGRRSSEELLAHIFDRFCVGK